MGDSVVNLQVSISHLVDMVIDWVEGRYGNQEMLSIAFFALHNCLVNGRPKDDIRSYIMRAVFNACNSYYDTGFSPLPTDVLAKEDSWSIPYEILEDDEARLIRLRYEYSYTVTEIAEKLHTSINQVKYRLSQAHTKLRFWYETEANK